MFQVGTQRNCRRNICRIDGGSPWLRTVRGEARQTYNALENLARGEPPEKASGTAEPLLLFTLSWVRVGSVSVPCLFRVVPCGLVVSSTDHAVMWIVSILAKMSPQNRYCAGVTSNGDRKTRTIQTFVGQRRRPENKQVSPSGKVSGRKVCPEGQRGCLRSSEGGMRHKSDLNGEDIDMRGRLMGDA